MVTEALSLLFMILDNLTSVGEDGTPKKYNYMMISYTTLLSDLFHTKTTNIYSRTRTQCVPGSIFSPPQYIKVLEMRLIMASMHGPISKMTRHQELFRTERMQTPNNIFTDFIRVNEEEFACAAQNQMKRSRCEHI